MYSATQFGASAYSRVGIETGIVGASPHRLIAMLYEGARKAVAQSRMHLVAGNLAGQGMAISKAINVIGGLQQGLNMEAGGAIAERLAALYDYMVRRLMQANRHSDESMLVEVDGLLATLEDAWRAIDPASNAVSLPASMEA